MSILEEMAQDAFYQIVEQYPDYRAALGLEDSFTTRVRFYAQAIEALEEIVVVHPIINMFVEELLVRAIKAETAKLNDRRYNFKSN